MSKRSANNKTVTMTATADTADLVDSTYPIAIQLTSATQRCTIMEVYLGGQSGASNIQMTVLARDSQLATGALTKDATLNDTLLDGHAAVVALTPNVFNKAATLKPRRDAAAGLLNLSFNAFGGIVRWVAAPGEEIAMFGVTASLGEISLSGYTGGTASGVLGAHIIFEPA